MQTWKHITASGITLAAAAGIIYQHLRDGSIQVTPLIVPPALASVGVSGHELTERLLDHVDSLRAAARLTSGQTAWIIETPAEYPDIEIPGIGMSLSTAIGWVDRFTGHHAVQMSWEMSARAQSQQDVNPWILAASVTGSRLHEVRFSPRNPDSALAAVAEAVLTDAEPYTEVRALSFAGRCDEARLLAARQLAAARTKKQLLVANSVMGFVSECGFDKTGRNDDEAAFFYREAIGVDPREPQPHASLAKLLADQGDSTSAREFKMAEQLGPTLASTYEAWGYALMLAYNYDSAIVKLRRAIELDPTSLTAYNNLGFAHVNLADTANAIAAFAGGVSRHPDIPALKEYGHLLLAKGRFSGAADAFRRAFQLGPNDVDTQYWLGVSLDSAGQIDASRDVFVAVARASKEGETYCAGAKRYLPAGTHCGPVHK
jgi:tetratricopeptide (TPR) repeat protein